MAQGEKKNIIPINIEDELRGSYIDYSMSFYHFQEHFQMSVMTKTSTRARILFLECRNFEFYITNFTRKSARIDSEVLEK